MSMYEMNSMFSELEKRRKPTANSLNAEEMMATRDRMRELFKNDPRVRLN